MNYSFYISPESYSVALEHGISKRTLEQRVQDAGWHTERAITTPTRVRKQYGNWVKVAESNGINPKIFRDRVNRYGYTMERAATKPVLSSREHMKVVGQGGRVYPKSVLDIAEGNGIGYGTFINRMKRGWSLEDAVKVKRTKPAESSIGWRTGPRMHMRKGVTV